jgi:hypothetical protein
MAWLSRVNFTASDVLSYTDVNNLGNDIRAWGGNVNAGGYTLSNVVLELLNISGGSSSSSVLTLLSTTGTGTTDSIVFKTGSQVQRMKITSAGVIVIGSADDLSISRNAAGVLQVGDGGSNANGRISAGQSTFDGLTVGRGAGSVTDNTAVGLNALQANTTGTQNSAFGRGALFTNSTGNFNTAIGRFSLYSNTSGGGNVALGGGSLYTNTTGSDNTAGGVNALFLNLTGSNNTVFGTSSMYSNSSGLDNAAFGNGCLISNTTGSRNVAVGLEAGYTATAANANTTGSNNVWIGYRSGPASTVQRTNSVAIGYQALVGADNAGVLGTAGMKWSVGGQTAPTATLYVQDATLVSGETKLTVRAGAGQTGALTEWLNAGASSVLAYVDPGGNIFANQVLDNTNAARLTSSGAAIASNKIYGFSSTTSSGGAADASLSRASAGVLQVGDGAANANGVVSLTRSQHAGVLVAALPAAAAGNAGSIQYVTDANATTIGSTVAGGGANKVMVWSNGAAWKIFAS